MFYVFGVWRNFGPSMFWGLRGEAGELTWEAMVPTALHVQSRQVQPNPHDLQEQSLPDLIHNNLVLAIQLGRSGHKAPKNGVDAT